MSVLGESYFSISLTGGRRQPRSNVTLLDNCVAPKLIIFKIENPSTYLKKQKYKDIFGLKESFYTFRTQEETQVLQNIKIHAGMED